MSCPLSTDRVPAQHGQPEVGKKAIVASRSRAAMPTFSNLMGTRCTLARRAICLGGRFLKFRKTTLLRNSAWWVLANIVRRSL
jgi:hypothetical protein